jgi:hypothetical protein
MSKPFKITTPEPIIGRTVDGKFARIPTPAQVIDKNSADTGATNGEANRAARVPDRAIGDGSAKDVSGPGANTPTPVYPDALPWPEAGPNNDAGKLPFKLR